MKFSGKKDLTVVLIGLFALYVIFVFPKIGMLPKFQNLTTKKETVNSKLISIETHYNTSSQLPISTNFPLFLL